MCQISAEMLSLIGGAVLDSLPTTVTIRHPVITQSVLKTATKSYAVVSSTVPARIEVAGNLSAEEQKIADKWMGKGLYRLLFTNSVDIKLDDEVVEPISGRIFHVVGCPNNISFSYSRGALAVEFTGN